MAPPRKKTKAPKHAPAPPEAGYPRADRPGKTRRHPRYDEHRDAILERLVGGDTLDEILRDFGLTWWEHHTAAKGNPAWAEAVAHARQAGLDAMVERTLNPDRYPDGKVANSWTRSVQWYAERSNREKYGQRLDVHHNVQIHLVAGLEHAAEAEKRLIEQRRIEASAQPAIDHTHDEATCEPSDVDPDWERIEAKSATDEDVAARVARAARKKK